MPKTRMFSSPLGRSRRASIGGNEKKEVSTPWRDTKTIEDPVEEFNYLLDRLSCLIEISNEAYQESLKSPDMEDSTRLTGFFRRRNKKGKEEKKKVEDASKPKDDNKEKKDEGSKTNDVGESQEEAKKDEDQANHSDNCQVDRTEGSNADDGDASEREVSDVEKDITKPAQIDAGESQKGDAVSEETKNKEEEEDQKAEDKQKQELSAQEPAKAAPATPNRPVTKYEPHTPPPTSPIAARRANKMGDAYFMNVAEEDECVEILRRIAELVVIGERIVSTQIVNEEKKKKHQQKQGWGEDITEDQDLDLKGEDRELDPDSQQYLPIFDNFFERNGLSFLVEILTGAVFGQQGDTFAPEDATADNPNSGDAPTDGVSAKPSEGDKDKNSGADSEEENVLPKGRWRFLPTMKIATQAVQSVSILVQNVSRATSLYFVLSNNHIDQLIGLPLDLYALAERNRLEAEGKPPLVTGKTFTTPELQELTTHFVTFLKSLAMRMNKETLQFFLKYPPQSDEDKESSEEMKAKKIEFPLYARALDFCAPHHDGFIRVTSLNICLNTLRLTTVVTGPDDCGGDASAESDVVGSSPDGVLHHADPLPFREALAIATHACTPSRVSRLASPIFTKLAELWGSLEGKFLDLDTPLKEEDLFPGKSKVPIDPIKERARKMNAFKDTAASLQDQLLLLDDLLKVSSCFGFIM